MKNVIAVIIWLIVLSALVFYLTAHSAQIKKLLHFSVADIILLISLFILTQFLNGSRTIFLVEKAGIGLNIWEAFNLANVNTMINYLPFKGGLFATAIYLKNRYSLSYTNFVSIVIANQLMQFLMIVFTASLFIIIYCLVTDIFFAKLFYLFCLLFVGILVALLFLKKVSSTELAVLKWDKVKKAINGLNIILNDKVLLLKLSCVNFLAILVMGARLAVSFKIISFNAPFILAFLAGAVKSIAVIFNIVPSGLGIAELFAGGVSEMMRAGIDVGLYAASVDRVVSVATLLFIGSLSFVYLYRRRGIHSVNREGRVLEDA